MKIAFTTSGDRLDAPLDTRFGRAAKFLLYDLDHETFEVIDNQQALNSPRGAGIQAAETIVRAGAGGVVTGHCGPKAFRTLSAAGIKIYTSDAATVADALAALKAGKLAAGRAVDVEGHWA